MKSTTFGLDIGISTLKAVWLSAEKDVITLGSCVVFPTPPHGMVSESPLDQEEMANAIKQTILEGKISVKAAHLALAENQVFTKVIEMPVLSDKELASAIRWEAEQYIPAPLNTMTLDHIVLKETKTDEGDRMLVLLVAAPTSLINRYKKILDMAGVTIASIETDILSVARSTIPPDSTQTSFIIHVGALSSSFAIIQAGTIVFTYAIPVGSLALDRAIAADFGFSLSQAEEYKKTYGIADSELGGKIGQAVAPILTTLIQETRKALAYYKERYRAQFPIEQLLLSGGAATTPGITAYFAKQCGIEAAVVHPFEVNKIENVPEEIALNAPEFGISVGLALKEYE